MPASWNRTDSQRVVQEIPVSGGKVIGFATDVTKRAEVEALVERAVDRFGRVDVLLNNAGVYAHCIDRGP